MTDKEKLDKIKHYIEGITQAERGGLVPDYRFTIYLIRDILSED